MYAVGGLSPATIVNSRSAFYGHCNFGSNVGVQSRSRKKCSESLTSTSECVQQFEWKRDMVTRAEAFEKWKKRIHDGRGPRSRVIYCQLHGVEEDAVRNDGVPDRLHGMI